VVLFHSSPKDTSSAPESTQPREDASNTPQNAQDTQPPTVISDPPVKKSKKQEKKARQKANKAIRLSVSSRYPTTSTQATTTISAKEQEPAKAPPVPEDGLLEKLSKDFYAHKKNSEKQTEELVEEIVKIKKVNAEGNCG
jgi:hypothetical protein